jgi:predicted RNA-binding Zn-ribbon protein involved in translation (DUF1610 family)
MRVICRVDCKRSAILLVAETPRGANHERPPSSAEFFTSPPGIFRARSAACVTRGRTAAVRVGTIVAHLSGMDALPVTASMSCPLCGRPVAPAADSTWVVAWYTCPRCGHDWSARIRNGRPDPEVAEDAFMHELPRKERP